MKPMIAGNWKLHGTIQMAAELIPKLKELVQGIDDVDILVCPPFTALRDSEALVRDSNIMLGAQDTYYMEEGAFTGEISPMMLKELQCSHVIVGHSERREYFMETNLIVNRKVKACMNHGLTPIMCVGETQQEKAEGITRRVIETELRDSLQDITREQAKNIIIAYEPIWAIGTGETATPEQAQEIHSFIRDILSKLFGGEAENMRILYGGSVKPDNIKELMAQQDINGALVGGASLEAEKFAEIVKGAKQS
ncbi:MAG: triose-phosphate isomerase [Candidatus Woesearchaeota archaeon]